NRGLLFLSRLIHLVERGLHDRRRTYGRQLHLLNLNSQAVLRTEMARRFKVDVSISCRPIVSTSSTVRSPITSRITLSERSRNVCSGSRAPKRYSLGSVMRYCTTHGTRAVLRSPVIIVSVSAGSMSPW